MPGSYVAGIRQHAYAIARTLMLTCRVARSSGIDSIGTGYRPPCRLRLSPAATVQMDEQRISLIRIFA